MFSWKNCKEFVEGHPAGTGFALSLVIGFVLMIGMTLYDGGHKYEKVTAMLITGEVIEGEICWWTKNYIVIMQDGFRIRIPWTSLKYIKPRLINNKATSSRPTPPIKPASYSL